MSSDDVRASDADRERALVAIRTACAEGRLSLDEFSARTEAALAARTRGDLEAILRDIVPSAPAVSRRPVATPTGRPSRFLAILSERKRTGRWRIEGRIEVASILGSCKLDLRDAEIAGDEVVVDVFILMGSLELLVPSGIEVELEDVSIMASSEDKRRPAAVLSGAPRLRVRGVCVMGSITVKDEERHWLTSALNLLGPPDSRLTRVERREERHEERRQRRQLDE